MSDAARTVDVAVMHDEAWFASRASRGVQGLRAYDPGHDLVAFRGGETPSSGGRTG